MFEEGIDAKGLAQHLLMLMAGSLPVVTITAISTCSISVFPICTVFRYESPLCATCPLCVFVQVYLPNLCLPIWKKRVMPFLPLGRGEDGLRSMVQLLAQCQDTEPTKAKTLSQNSLILSSKCEQLPSGIGTLIQAAGKAANRSPWVLSDSVLN